MMVDINKHWCIITEESCHELFLFPYIHLMFLLGWELTIGWVQYSITLSYHSDDDIKVMEEIKNRL